MWQIWLLIVIIILLTTYRYPSSFIFSIFIASLCPFISSFILNNLLLETLIFIISTLLAASIHTLFLTHFHPLPKHIHTSSRCLIEQTGIIIKPIYNTPLQSGLVQINHETWPATSSSNLSEGLRVKVIGVQGVRLVVTPLNEHIVPVSN